MLPIKMGSTAPRDNTLAMDYAMGAWARLCSGAPYSVPVFRKTNEVND